MAYRDGASSVQGILMRITPLTVDGLIDGTKPVHWTKGFISLSFSPEVTTGDEIETKAADGSVCVSWKADDSLKRINLNLSLCNVDPEALILLSGGKALVNASEQAVGYTSAPVGSTIGNPVALEVWSYRNVGGKPGTPPYWQWAFPYVKVRYDGEREFGNAALANTFTGQGVGNVALCTTGLYPASAPYTTIKSRAAGNSPEVFNYASARYGSALVNPFSYVEAGDQNIPAMLDPAGTNVCVDCAGSYLPVAWADQYTVGVGEGCVGGATKGSAKNGDVFPAEPTVTASDSTNAAKLAGLGYVASPTTNWTAGQKILVGSYAFNWSGTAWAAGAHA